MATRWASRLPWRWWIASRQHLLDALLDQWEATNTAALVEQAAAPAATITEAVCNVFRCFVDDDLFNTRLDFAVREWARRSGGVRKRLDRSDEARLDALTAMFARHGFDPRDAETRARVLYYMQIGYTFAELNEPLDVRLARVPDYLLAFTGQRAQPGEVEALAAYSRAVMERTK
jgi:AcrR family transcriptional regulator